MIISSFAFSLMHLCVKAMPHIPVFELVFFRSLGSLLITFFYLNKGKTPIFGNNKKVLFARGVFGTIGLCLFFITLQNIPLAGAVTIQYLSPVFTTLFAVILLGERVKKLQWLFFYLAFTGVCLLKGFDISGQISYYFILIGVVSACFSGLAYNCIRYLRTTEVNISCCFLFSTCGNTNNGGLSFFNWVKPQGLDWFYIVVLGVVTQVAQVFMTKGIQSDSAGNIMTYKYVGVIFAFIYGYFIFKETYSFLSVFGIFLLLSGVILNAVFKNQQVKKNARKKLKNSEGLANFSL